MGPRAARRSRRDDTPLDQGQKWTRSTVITLLQRLEKKGYVESDKSQYAFVFRALVSREDVIAIADERSGGRTMRWRRTATGAGVCRASSVFGRGTGSVSPDDRRLGGEARKARLAMIDHCGGSAQNAITIAVLIPLVAAALPSLPQPSRGAARALGDRVAQVRHAAGRDPGRCRSAVCGPRRLHRQSVRRSSRSSFLNGGADAQIVQLPREIGGMQPSSLHSSRLERLTKTRTLHDCLALVARRPSGSWAWRSAGSSSLGASQSMHGSFQRAEQGPAAAHGRNRSDCRANGYAAAPRDCCSRNCLALRLASGPASAGLAGNDVESRRGHPGAWGHRPRACPPPPGRPFCGVD